MNLVHTHPAHQDFSPEEFGRMADFLQDVGQSNAPIAVMLTCWERDCAGQQVPRARPGEIMIVQNPAGIVAPANVQNRSVTLDSILYNLQLPTVRHLIVCGHTQCKTLGKLAEDGPNSGNPLGRLVRPVSERCCSMRANRTERELRELLIQENTLQQLVHLKSHAYVQSQLNERRLLLHAWLRDDSTSEITAYSPLSGQFGND